jgi:geranylgeranyl pyrophosphate synthase
MQHPTLDRLKAEANSAIDAFLERWPKGSADGLYDPIHYLMSIGGKRLRAVLAFVGGRRQKGMMRSWRILQRSRWSCSTTSL